MTEKLINCCLALLILLLLPLILLFFLVYTSIDYFKYRKTRYFKDTREKYTWLATVSYYVKLYDAIKQADLPIRYYRCEDVHINAYGYFIFDDTLLIPDYDLVCNTEGHEEKPIWTVEIEEEYINIEDAVKQDIDKCNSFLGVEAVNKALILCDFDSVSNKDFPEFKNCEVLLITASDTATALKQYIRHHSKASTSQSDP